MFDRFMKGNPYLWWNQNKERYPKLSDLAKKYLCASPTSVPSERLFSGAGQIYMYDDRRSHLAPEKAEMLLYIRNNFALVGDKYTY